MKGFLSVLVVLPIFVIGVLSKKIGNTTLDDEAWWGPEELRGKTDNISRPFKIRFTDEMIQDLRYRLNNHRQFTPPLKNVTSEYGWNGAQMESWIKYWAEQYPFKQQEDFLNQFSHFKIFVQGIELHYMEVGPTEVPEGVEVVPCLMLHGFPGSIREFYEVIPLLTKVSPDRDFALKIIAPSLVGYGFSAPAVRPDMGATEMAVVFKNLMEILGYDKFYVQGGDWGSMIGSLIATLFPDSVLGFHTNFALSQNQNSILYWLSGAAYPQLIVDSSAEDRMYPITKVLKFLTRELGYMHIQSAKPDTIGIALADTPSGLLAYILQLFSIGTRSSNYNSVDGGLDEHYSRSSLIDNLMMYWVPNNIVTACRLYAETLNLRTVAMGISAKATPVPTWTIHAKDEIFYQSPFLLRFKFPNLINSTLLNTGGHFLALELPEVLAEDLLRAISAFRRSEKSCV